MSKMLYLIICLLEIVSCNERDRGNSLEKPNKEITDIRSYAGNAFIFTDPDIYRDRCFIIPVKEKDSATFKKLNVTEAIQGKICIQMFFGRSDLLRLINDKNKEIITFKACNLPKDSMFFSRVFISYKNCLEMKRNRKDENGNLMEISEVDSCNSKLVERTDSTEFYLHIYNLQNH